jgi:hypothetical protein
MKIHLEMDSETLAGVRAELEAFLTLEPARITTAAIGVNPIVQGPGISRSNVTVPNMATNDAPAPSAADIALGLAAETPSDKPTATPLPTRGNGLTRSAADIALGLDGDEDISDSENDANEDVEELDDTDLEDVVQVEEAPSPPSEAEALLADKAQLNFDFDCVLALQGRAAALGIVRGVLPRGTKTKLKDIESLPVELIPAAIAALQAAEAN